MCLNIETTSSVPEETARIALTDFPKVTPTCECGMNSGLFLTINNLLICFHHMGKPAQAGLHAPNHPGNCVSHSHRRQHKCENDP